MCHSVGNVSLIEAELNQSTSEVDRELSVFTLVACLRVHELAVVGASEVLGYDRVGVTGLGRSVVCAFHGFSMAYLGNKVKGL